MTFNRNRIYLGLAADVRPTLFFEFVGSPTSVNEQIETVKWCTDEAEGKTELPKLTKS